MTDTAPLFSPHYILLATRDTGTGRLAIGLSPFLYTDLQKKNGLDPRRGILLIQGIMDNLKCDDDELKSKFGPSKLPAFQALRKELGEAVLAVTTTTVHWNPMRAYETILLGRETDLEAKGQALIQALVELVSQKHEPRAPTVARVREGDVDNLDLIMETTYRRNKLEQALDRAEGKAAVRQAEPRRQRL